MFLFSFLPLVERPHPNPREIHVMRVLGLQVHVIHDVLLKEIEWFMNLTVSLPCSDLFKAQILTAKAYAMTLKAKAKALSPQDLGQNSCLGSVDKTMDSQPRGSWFKSFCYGSCVLGQDSPSERT